MTTEQKIDQLESKFNQAFQELLLINSELAGKFSEIFWQGKLIYFCKGLEAGKKIYKKNK